MYTTIASFIVVLALMVGGSGLTAFAAQNSLPNQSLYQIKTFTEDLTLRSMQRNEHRLQVELNYSDRRVLEMVRLREMQQVVPESTITRWENHLDQSLLIAANSEGNEMVRALKQIRERLENQAGLLVSCPDQDPLQVRLREMIQTRIAWTELGLDDPNEFHQQAQVRAQLSFVLEGVISQMLLPKANGKGRVMCCEVMVPTPAIRNLIREDKVHQLYSNMQMGQDKFQMQTMNQHLHHLVSKKIITTDLAMTRSHDPEELRQMINRAGGKQADQTEPVDQSRYPFPYPTPANDKQDN